MAEAVDASLTVQTKERLQEDRGIAQRNLGNALSNQSRHASGEAGTQLLVLAVADYREALMVYNKVRFSLDWVGAAGNLAKALFMNKRSSG